MPITYNVLDNQWRWRPAFSGAAVRTKYFPEAASANFRYGEPVILSGESVTQIAALPGNNTASAALGAASLVLGWALADATGVTGNQVPILLARNVEVLVRIYNGTGSNAELQDVNVGDLAPLIRYQGASNRDVFLVVGDAPSGTAGENKALIVEKYAPFSSSVAGEQAATDDYGLVWIALRDAHTVQGQ